MKKHFVNLSVFILSVMLFLASCGAQEIPNAPSNSVVKLLADQTIVTTKESTLPNKSFSESSKVTQVATTKESKPSSTSTVAKTTHNSTIATTAATTTKAEVTSTILTEAPVTEAIINEVIETTTVLETEIVEVTELTEALIVAPEAETRDFILNKNTGKFHEVGCHSAAKIKDSNQLEVNDTWDNVISMGYVPCKNCH